MTLDFHPIKFSVDCNNKPTMQFFSNNDNTNNYFPKICFNISIPSFDTVMSALEDMPALEEDVPALEEDVSVLDNNNTEISNMPPDPPVLNVPKEFYFDTPTREHTDYVNNGFYFEKDLKTCFYLFEKIEKEYNKFSSRYFICIQFHNVFENALEIVDQVIVSLHNDEYGNEYYNKINIKTSKNEIVNGYNLNENENNCFYFKDYIKYVELINEKYDYTFEQFKEFSSQNISNPEWYKYDESGNYIFGKEREITWNNIIEKIYYKLPYNKKLILALMETCSTIKNLNFKLVWIYRKKMALLINKMWCKKIETIYIQSRIREYIYSIPNTGIYI